MKSEERNFDLEADIVTIQAETMFQVKTVIKEREDKIKYLEKQLQRETTERRIAEVKLSEVRRSSAVVAVTTAAGGGKDSMHCTKSGLLSPPWKDQRKSDPIHPSLYKENNPPLEALGSTIGSKTARNTAVHIDKEPNNAHYKDLGATTDFGSSDTPSLRQGSCAQVTDQPCTDLESKNNDIITKQQHQIPVSSECKQPQQHVKGFGPEEGSRNTTTYDTTAQIAIDLLQDVSQLTAELSQQLDDHEVSYYKQRPAPLWNDWEQLKAILCEVIDAYRSNARIGVPEVIGTSPSPHSTVSIELVTLTVLDIIARHKSDYRGVIQQRPTFNRGSNRCHYESCVEISRNNNENKSVEPNPDSYSQCDDPSYGRRSLNYTEEQRILGLHILNLLIFLERIVRLSSVARVFSIRGLLWSSSYNASTNKQHSTEQNIPNSKAKTINGSRLDSIQKRICGSQDHGNSSQLARRGKRRRIFVTSGVASGVTSQPDPSVSCFQQSGILLHSESFSLFFCWMKGLLFHCNDWYDMSSTTEHETKAKVTSNRSIQPSLRCLDDLILLTLLRLLSTLVWESDSSADEMCLRMIRADRELPLNASHVPNHHSSTASGDLGEEVLASLIYSSQSDRNIKAVADNENHQPASLKNSTLQPLQFVDVLSSMFRSLVRRRHSDLPSRRVSSSLPELHMKCTVVQLYQKILSSTCGLAFSRLVVTSDSTSVKGECILLALHELDFCLKFLKKSSFPQAKKLCNSRIFKRNGSEKESECVSLSDEVSNVITVKLTLNIVKMLISYLQVDPLNGAAFLHHKYHLHGESKLSWLGETKSPKNQHSMNTQPKSGVASLIEGLEFASSTLLCVSSQKKNSCEMSIERAHLLGLLIHSEMQIFSMLLSHIQSVDHSMQPVFGDQMSSLLHIIGDSKACFCSSCCLIAQYSDSCSFIDDASRYSAQHLLEEIKLDEEDEEHF
jgi:hypothetical protein